MSSLLKIVPQQDSSLDEKRLVARCAEGDMQSLAALFDAHVDHVRRFVARMLGSDLDVEDVVQNTFLELPKSAAKYRAEAAVSTWILGNAANQCRRYLRTKGRWVRLKQALTSQPAPPVNEQKSEHQLLLQHISTALATLPIRHRETFLLCDVEQLSCVEAAAQLNRPVGTIYRHLFEARKALRKACEEQT